MLAIEEQQWTKSPREFSARRVINEGLKDSPLRPFLWMVYLGVLPEVTEEWPGALKAHRERYNEINKKGYNYIHPPTESQGERGVAASTVEHLKVLEQIIDVETPRMFPGYPFFKQQWVRTSIYRIIRVFCIRNDAEYCSGMHEIVGLFVYIVSKAQDRLREELRDTPSSDGIPSLAVPLESDPDIGLPFIRDLCLEETVDSDSSILFEALMTHIYGLYIDIEGRVTVKEKTTEIFHGHVKKMLPELYEKTTAARIDPQLFMIRWLRLVFSREFSHSCIFTLWDIIFADGWLEGQVLRLCDFLPISLLRARQRAILQANDYTDFMPLLLNPFSDASKTEVVALAHAAIIDSDAKYLSMESYALSTSALIADERRAKPSKGVGTTTPAVRVRVPGSSDKAVQEEILRQQIIGVRLNELIEQLQDPAIVEATGGENPNTASPSGSPDSFGNDGSVAPQPISNPLQWVMAELKSLRDICMLVTPQNSEVLREALDEVAPWYKSDMPGFEAVVDALVKENSLIVENVDELERLKNERSRLRDEMGLPPLGGVE